MGANDLATLVDVKDWLNSTVTGDDKTLARMITGVSGQIYSYLSRQVIVPQTITERYDGLGNSRILLRNYPVLSVATLLVDGVNRQVGSYPTTASTSQGWPPNGYVFSPWDGRLPGKPQILDTFNSTQGTRGCAYGLPRGRQNVQVTYACGYQVTGEVATVPATTPFTVTVQAGQGPWASDRGVVYAATGAALVAVPAGPVLGQYVAPTTANQDTAAVYTFSSADAGAGMLVSYGFVPSPLNMACIEWVAERYRYRNRIGQRTQAVSGVQTASYDLSAVPGFVKALLDPYKNVVPFMDWS